MAILFDIGKTNIRVAFSDDLETFQKPLVVPTPFDFDEAYRVLSDAIRAASMGRAINLISGGLPGTLNPEGTGLQDAPAPIQNWMDRNLASELMKDFQAPVKISNDTVLVGLGEVTHGAGKNSPIVGYVTFSTGVGGARFSNGAPDPSARGFEPGKLQVPHLGVGNTIEHYASGNGLRTRFNKAPTDIADPTVWEEGAKAAGYLMHALELMWSPNLLVIGGPMVLGDPAIPLVRIEQVAKELLGKRGRDFTLKRAELGGFGGLWGALEIAKRFA